MTTAIPNQALPRECDAYLMVMDRSWDTCTADATEPHETRSVEHFAAVATQRRPGQTQGEAGEARAQASREHRSGPGGVAADHRGGRLR